MKAFPEVRGSYLLRNSVCGGSRLRVLLAVVVAAEEGASVTLGDVCLLTGMSKATAWTHLDHLREDGFLTWEPGLVGTLRPCLARRPIGV